MAAEEDERAAAEARRLLVDTAARLAAEGAPDEALAVLEPAGRRFGLPRAARMRPLGRVWRLGVLLLRPDGSALAVGAVTRATPAGHARHGAVSVEARREVRAAANRGRFTPGETVEYDARPLDLSAAALRDSDGPLLLRDGRVLVRWSVSAPPEAGRELRPYLDERMDLLLRPPQGAT